MEGRQRQFSNPIYTVKTKSNPKKHKTNRKLQIEELEGREMLDAGLFAAINEAYSSLDLGDDWTKYEFTEIKANELNIFALQNAQNRAYQTPGDDIIVVHTDANNHTISLASTLEFSNTGFSGDGGGSIIIVSLGDVPLTLDGNNQNRVVTMTGNVEVALGGVVITNGYATTHGGGISVEDQAGILTLDNCVIIGNKAVQGGGISNGGTITVTNTLIIANHGGGVSILENAIATFDYCTIAYNAAAPSALQNWGYGIKSADNSTLSVSNSIIAYNAGNNIDSHANATVDETGNYFAVQSESDTLFVDAFNGDFRLRFGSPAHGMGVLPYSASEGYNSHEYNLLYFQGLLEYADWTLIDGEYRLTSLYANYGDQTSVSLTGDLDLSGCMELTSVQLKDHQLTSLNLAGSTKLEGLWVQGNNLTSLNLAGLENLGRLEAAWNNLTEINLDGCENLHTLLLSQNQLTEIDLAGMTKLENLDVSGNKLTELDMAGQGKLTTLYANNNHLTKLNLTGLTELVEVHVGNNYLSELNLAGLSKLEQLYANNNRLTDIGPIGIGDGGSPELANIDISYNQLSFSRLVDIQANLPIQSSASSYYDAGQTYALPAATESDRTVKLYDGIEAINGKKTEIQWFNLNGELLEVSYLEVLPEATPGGPMPPAYLEYILPDSLAGQYVYAVMTNEAVPGVEITTSLIYIYDENNEAGPPLLDVSVKEVTTKTLTLDVDKLPGILAFSWDELIDAPGFRGIGIEYRPAGNEGGSEKWTFDFPDQTRLFADGLITLSGLLPGTEYELQIHVFWALDTVNQGWDTFYTVPLAGTAEAFKTVGIPAAPENLRIEGYVLLWAPSADAVNYLVEKSTDGIDWDFASLAIGAFSSSITLQSDTNYWYRVTAIGKWGDESEPSEAFSTHNEYEWDLVQSQGLADYADWKFIDGQYRLVSIITNSASWSGLPSAIDLTNCTELEYADIRGYNTVLESLDLTGCVKLFYLDVGANMNLTSVQIAGLSNLQTLNLNNNPALLEIDLTGLTRLESFSAFQSQPTSITGLEANNLPALKTLTLTYNTEITELSLAGFTNLENLDVRLMSALKSLTVTGTKITSLDLTGTTNLTDLVLTTNKITAIDLAGLTNLTKLMLSGNNIEAIDLAGLTKLEYMDLSINPITELDLSQLTTNLHTLWLQGTNLGEINLTGLTGLKTLGLGGNFDDNGTLLTSLDLSGLVNLQEFQVNQTLITELDFTGLTKLSGIVLLDSQLTTLRGLGDIEGTLNKVDISGNCFSLSELDTIYKTLQPVLFVYSLEHIAQYGDHAFQYAGQTPVIPEYTSNNRTVDLSSEFEFDGHETVFTWYGSEGILSPGLVEHLGNGIFQFNASLDGQSLRVHMTNAAFPALGLMSDVSTRMLSTAIEVGIVESSGKPTATLTPDDTGDAQLSLNWQPVDWAAAYKVEMSTDGITWTTLATLTETSYHYTHTPDVPPEHNLYFRIIGINNTGDDSPPSDAYSLYNAYEWDLIKEQERGLNDAGATGRYDTKWEIIGDEYRLVEISVRNVGIPGENRAAPPVDLSGCTELRLVIINAVNTTSIDLRGCEKLESITIGNAQYLEELHISGLENLKKLGILSLVVMGNGGLGKLDISSLKNLEELLFEHAIGTTELDLTGLSKLTRVSIVAYNPEFRLETITGLDGTNQPELETLRIMGVPIESLELAGFSKLTDISIENMPELTSLAVTGTPLTAIDTLVLPGLKHLDVSDNQLATLNVSGLSLELETLNLSDNCLLFSELERIRNAVPDGVRITFGNQSPAIPEFPGTDRIVDLSKEYQFGEYVTTFTWYDSDGDVVTSGIEPVGNGKFQFAESLAGQSFYVVMTNDAFPEVMNPSTEILVTDVIVSMDSPQVGDTVSATLIPSSIDSDRVNYRWYRGEDWLSDSDSYTLTSEDVGHVLRVIAYYQVPGAPSYSLPIASYTTNAVTIPLTGITVDNTSPKVGDTLSATYEPGDATATYQWYRGTELDGYTKIEGATESSYQVTFSDSGYTLKLVAVGTGNYAGEVSHTVTNAVPAQSSLTAVEFVQIRTKHAGLNLSENMNDYNIIVIDAHELSDVALRSAIAEAGTTAGNDLIVLRTTTTQNKITLNGELRIDVDATQWGSITIVAFGDDQLTLDANQQSRVLYIEDVSNAALAELTITNGNTNSNGGGIFNRGALTITNSSIENNKANNQGGGIYNLGELSITDSTVENNTAISSGGGIRSTSSNAMLTIVNSTIAGNVAGNYGSGGGISNTLGTVNVTNSIIAGNRTDGAYGGGGIASEGGTFFLTNSIVAGNAAFAGAGIWTSAKFTITNSIIAGNIGTSDIPSSGIGILFNGTGATGTTTLTINNTIVAGNAGADILFQETINNTYVLSIIGSHSLIGTTTGGHNLSDTASNIVGVDPQFVQFDSSGTWRSNLWKEWDLRLAAGSPAIDQGDNDLAVDAGGNPLTVDNDGKPRIFNGTVDIGAYEYDETSSPKVDISGITINNTSPQVGDTLTATPEPGTATANYQWYRGTESAGYEAITGAIFHSYTVTTADIGYALRVVAVGIGDYTGEEDATTNEVPTPAIELAGVSISTNSPLVGTILTAAIFPNTATATYQWYRGEDMIEDATSNTYIVTEDDIGYALRVVATGTGGYTGEVDATTNAVPIPAIELAGVSISTDSPQVGTILTAAIFPNTATVTYQWYRGEYIIEDATSRTYTVTTDDIGYALRVVATGTGGYTGEVDATTNAVPTPAPDPIELAGIEIDNLSPKVGDVITATIEPGVATANYQWYRGTESSGYVPIFGATSSTYTVTTADIGDALSVVVTGTGNYTGEVISTTTNAVPILDPIALTGVTISNNAPQVGNVLTATLTPDTATAAYQWQRLVDGTWQDIATATSSTYTVTEDDIGYVLRVAATGTGDYTGEVNSTTTNAVPKPIPGPARITAVQKNGTTLLAAWSIPTDVLNVENYTITISKEGMADVVFNDISLRNANGTLRNSTELTFDFTANGAGEYIVSIIARGVDGVHSIAVTDTILVATDRAEEKAAGTFSVRAIPTSLVAGRTGGLSNENTIVLELNRHATKPVQNVSHYIITCTSHPALGTFVVPAEKDKDGKVIAQDFYISELRAGTTYRFNIVVVGEDGNPLRQQGTNVSAQTVRPANSISKAPLGIKAAGGLNSVTLTGLKPNTTYSIDVWQTTGRAVTHNSVKSNQNDMRDRGEFRGYYKTIVFKTEPDQTTYVVDGLNRNSQSAVTADGESRLGLRYQFRISEEISPTMWSTARSVNGSTANINSFGWFAAVKGTGYVVSTNTLRFNISPVAEVTHYEIGIRKGTLSVGFVEGNTGAMEFTTDTLLALIGERKGYSIVGDKIRIEAGALEPNAAGRVTIADLLPPGLRCTLAIRAVVVGDTGVVERESSNANCTVRVPV